MRGSNSLSAAAGESAELSPRAIETLKGLLEGLSEKQVAKRLALSKHTVHSYVKALYRRFEVNSRSELLAIWISSGELPDVPKPSGTPKTLHSSLVILRERRLRLARELAHLDQQIEECQRSFVDTSTPEQCLLGAGAWMVSDTRSRFRNCM